MWIIHKPGFAPNKLGNILFEYMENEHTIWLELVEMI